MSPSAPPTLAPIAGRIDACLDQLLTSERDRWCGLDGDLAAPFEEIRRMVSSGGKRLRPAFCHWAFIGAGGDPDDERVVRAGAAFELMHAFAPLPRRRDGRLGEPPGRPDDARRLRRRARPRVMGGGVAPLRRGRRHPRRGPRVRALRPVAPRCPGRGVGALERAAHRAQHRPVPGPPGLRPGRAPARQGRTDRPLQERQVHDRTAPAPRRHVGRTGAARRAGPGAQRVRPSARRRVPDARRRDRHVRRHGRDRQTGRRRPARGQADTAARPRCRAGRSRASVRSWRSSVARV